MQDKDKVVFALAHNTIVRWDSYNGQVLDVVQCEENSILYPFLYLSFNFLLNMKLLVNLMLFIRQVITFILSQKNVIGIFVRHYHHGWYL